MEIFAQIVGIVAAALNISSYQCKTKNRIILIQLFGGAFFTVNFMLHGATTGAIMNVLAMVRALLFLHKDKLKLNDKILVGSLIAAFVVSYILAFTALGVEPTAKNFILEALPI